MELRHLFAFAVIIGSTFGIYGQSKSGSANGGTASSSSSKDAGGGKGDSSSQTSADSKSAQAPSGRIEVDILAYEASRSIAEKISKDVKTYLSAQECSTKKDSTCTVVLYDGPTFATLQAYDAYAAMISALESGFTRLPRKGAEKPPEGQREKAFDLSTMAGGVSAALGALAALRSTADYTHEALDLNADALSAQLATALLSQRSGRAVTVVIPKLVLLSTPDEYKNSGTAISDCANTKKGVNAQIGCLLGARAAADPADPGFAALDKALQAFIQSLMGGGGSDSSQKSSTQDQKQEPKKDTTNSEQDAQSDAGKNNSGQSQPNSLLSSVIQGRRLRAKLGDDENNNSRILVLEATTAGGSYKTVHSFWAELFYTTPAPSYNGGAVVTYMLIDPATSAVEAADVRHFMFRYGKFQKSAPISSAEEDRP